eukprot:TRINITY_DN17498_c0_g1_i1.p1 TRINITY_DN17498_c0_g1~~TRINITY_DN17498_c0_g1_i1.p1  ORF type:complete len:108 (+),score=22.91 TRINITY_DN17498_c0_g1_i1:49-324(+)
MCIRDSICTKCNKDFTLEKGYLDKESNFHKDDGKDLKTFDYTPATQCISPDTNSSSDLWKTIGIISGIICCLCCAGLIWFIARLSKMRVIA